MAIETQEDVERIMLERDVAFHFDPLLTEQPDGSWVARYPGADWSVTGSDKEQAGQRLRAEILQRIGTPDAHKWKINAVRHHIENGPIVGVYEIPNADFDRAVEVGTGAVDAALEAARNRVKASLRDGAEK